MKTSACLFAVLVSACSFAVEVPALPRSVFTDTEVSTNFTFAVGEGSNRRLVFSLELEATPTNNVEIAVGCDADEDGSLTLGEEALAVGYDCGEWFVRSAANDSVAYSDAVDSGVFHRCALRVEARARRRGSECPSERMRRIRRGSARRSIRPPPTSFA